MSINPLLEAYRALKREIALVASSLLKKHGISQKQMTMLFYISENSQATASDLAFHTQSDPAAVTRALGSLEKAGYLKRETDPSDNRKTHLTLTAKGKAKAEKLEEIRSELSTRISDTVSASDLKELERLMRTVAEGLLARRQKG
jgi:DNA-binding MarR family transcriptional regulator